MSEMKKFAVSYTIDYQHRVVVGVSALNTDSAIEIASKAFDEGVIWDDSPEMPLLFDDYEECEGESLTFAAEEIPAFPEPDSSVKQLKVNQFAFNCAQALLSGETALAFEFAQKALPSFPVSQPEEATFAVKSANGCDPFEITACNKQQALEEALFALGWTVSVRTGQVL